MFSIALLCGFVALVILPWPALSRKQLQDVNISFIVGYHVSLMCVTGSYTVYFSKESQQYNVFVLILLLLWCVVQRQWRFIFSPLTISMAELICSIVMFGLSSGSGLVMWLLDNDGMAGVLLVVPAMWNLISIWMIHYRRCRYVSRPEEDEENPQAKPPLASAIRRQQHRIPKTLVRAI